MMLGSSFQNAMASPLPRKLFAKETGLGWDNVKNIVDAPNEWWEQKITENSKYDKFRNKRLPFCNELTILFKDVAAIGEFAWAPSSEILPNGLSGNDNDEKDGYHPYPIIWIWRKVLVIVKMQVLEQPMNLLASI
ncbi:hypothetical protein V6N12_027507 [Hibiscus sabdariffa]|uniref:Uncharacterized protein n=1 Tax=Hibiscus sabdariffa TaxID=183260 RepID=A0ABR2F337_9ROSI